MSFDYHKPPGPWFGGKTHAAAAVWQALGDVAHYVEPFMGMLGVLLNRPHEPNRVSYSETVNDLDGFLVNAFRCIQMQPDETAEWCSWPVIEADLMARHLWLLRWKQERNLERLMGDPLWYHPQAGGWWLWGLCSWIGSGWCSGQGPWVVGEDGRIMKRPKAGAGVCRQLPHLGNDGQGVNAPQLREPGVSRQRPHLIGDGQGVLHAGLREPGVESESVYHPLIMPKLRAWFGFLAARLRHVRILNGDWKRAVTGCATLTLPCRQGGNGVCGVFLDPPYSTAAERTSNLYVEEDLQVAVAAREWALATGPDPRYRIVFAGFAGEHGSAFEDAGWREVEWFQKGFLRGGMGHECHQQHRERLWLSPHCLRGGEEECPLFAGLAEE